MGRIKNSNGGCNFEPQDFFGVKVLFMQLKEQQPQQQQQQQPQPQQQQQQQQQKKKQKQQKKNKKKQTKKKKQPILDPLILFSMVFVGDPHRLFGCLTGTGCLAGTCSLAHFAEWNGIPPFLMTEIHPRSNPCLSPIFQLPGKPSVPFF